jgi:hypothetical protein
MPLVYFRFSMFRLPLARRTESLDNHGSKFAERYQIASPGRALLARFRSHGSREFGRRNPPLTPPLHLNPLGAFSNDVDSFRHGFPPLGQIPRSDKTYHRIQQRLCPH